MEQSNLWYTLQAMIKDNSQSLPKSYVGCGQLLRKQRRTGSGGRCWFSTYKYEKHVEKDPKKLPCLLFLILFGNKNE